MNVNLAVAVAVAYGSQSQGGGVGHSHDHGTGAVWVQIRLLVDLSDMGGLLEGIRDGDGVVLQTGGGWPHLVNSLERDKASEGETIEVDWHAEGGVRVWLGEESHEDPSWRDENSDTDIWSGVQSQEVTASPVDFSHLACWVGGHVLLVQLVDAMLEVELWDEEESLGGGEDLSLLSGGEWLADCCLWFDALALLLFVESKLVLNENIDW